MASKRVVIKPHNSRAERKREVKQLDDLFSEYIRRRAIQRVNGCERCLTPKRDIVKENGDILPAWQQLQCAHFRTKSKKSTRFDEDNAIGFCGACHIYFHGRGDEFTIWMKNHLGEQVYDLLDFRAHKPTKIDEKLIGLYLKDLISKLEEI